MRNHTLNIQPISHTKLKCLSFSTADDLARHVADVVARVITERDAMGQKAVLGLPTGSTPVGVYRELARLHRDEGLDFSNVITFNLDEYYGLAAEQLQSYHRWMREHFFDHINIPPENYHLLNGTLAEEHVSEHCRDYEARIADAGGIDVLLLGIGRNGHVGFNEPFSDPAGRTRLCTLDPVTRKDAASDFFGEENVPQQALTMGLGTILESRKIFLLALGEHKAEIIRQTAEQDLTPRVPASFLQRHNDATLVLDAAATSALTAVATPWLVERVEWDDPLIKRAVLWLCEQSDKALLKLDDDDFREHNLHQLLRRHGPAPRLAHDVFRWMMDTIVYHPAGKDSRRVICFSPHPDDDVISMGGTLTRLVADGHQVHVAYMTSGNIAVFDHDAHRVADLAAEYNRLFDIDRDRSQQIEASVLDALKNKQAGDPDHECVQRIKGLIRWGEAKAGAITVGCREENLHFLDLPFYRTGVIAKHPVGPRDVQIVRELIERVQPRQIYVAGDLSDPHGTHRVCAQTIFAAISELRTANSQVPDVLLYRGAWQEYALHEIDLAVPLSPSDMQRKLKAIFMHESQKDEALFPGSDPREFWQRAEDRNKSTADKYNRIGLPEYYALEAFVHWRGGPI